MRWSRSISYLVVGAEEENSRNLDKPQLVQTAATNLLVFIPFPMKEEVEEKTGSSHCS